jgi:hypothetical protein
LFNSANLTPQSVIAQVSQGLVIVRAAMDVAGDLYAWSSGVAESDLEGIGMSSGDAGAILSAVADAYGLNRHYNTGVADGTYPSGYIFGASQRIVIGPRPS